MALSCNDAIRTRLALMRAALPALALAVACGPREAQKPAPSPTPKAPDPQRPVSAPPLWSWVDSRAPLVMMWRPPHHNAPVLADLFAFPAKAAQLYAGVQARVKDTERFLGRPLVDPELVAFAGGSTPGTLVVMRASDSDYQALAAKIKDPAAQPTAHHEWTCATSQAQHHQSLCLLDKPDIAWVSRQATDRALDLLRMSRDLPPASQQKALAKAMGETPRPIALLFSFLPALHLELDEDPTSFQWTLFSFGKRDPTGRPGWTGLSRMQHPNPQAALTTLKSAQGLEDAPKAKALRERAHLESPAPGSLEIHLEVHGDDPQAP